ncbi:MAG: DMT family transporter [Spirochaetaceae bacterium]|nr:DMT family transporter [Spirochaetaceae bacterium]
MIAVGVFIAFAHAVCWSATSVVLRHLSQRLDPFVLNGLRALLGAAVIVVWFLAAGAPGASTFTPERILLIVAAIVVGGLVGDTCSVVALRLVGVARTVPVICSFPIFTMLFGFLLLGDAPPLLAMFGALLVVAAGALLSLPERRPRAAPRTAADGTQAPIPDVARRKRRIGLLLATITAAVWGLEVILTAKAAEGMTTLAVNAVRVPIAALLSLSVALRRPGALDAAERVLSDRRTLWLLILGGLLGWVVVGMLYVESIKLAGATFTAIVGATAPLYAAPLSALLLREPPGAMTLAATMLAVAGVILVLLA